MTGAVVASPAVLFGGRVPHALGRFFGLTAVWIVPGRREATPAPVGTVPPSDVRARYSNGAGPGQTGGPVCDGAVGALLGMEEGTMVGS